MSESRSDTDVLVVGAGPTGLMLANQLVRRGARTMIIDRHAGPAEQTRAVGVQARTLEIYAHLGIAARAVELGQRTSAANMWALGHLAARVPFGDIGAGLSPYPYVLILGQDDNERLLGESLGRLGTSIAWNTELVGLSQGPEGAAARIRQPDGSVRDVSCAWIAGCDGAHSAVREQCAIPFAGAPYEHVFFVADTQMTGPMQADEINVYLWNEGFHLFFPMRGKDHWRIIGIVPPTLRGKSDLTMDDVFPSVRAEAGPRLDFRGCSWFSTYRIHHRRAARFRERRCFLLGDAAHIHSPVGAQGMNTGLQDAYNLAWKLALVVSGRAGVPLLDSYEAERLPVAARLLGTTDRLFSFIVSENPLSQLFRTRVLPKMLALAMSSVRIQRAVFRAISQIAIRYRDSPLSESLDGIPESAPHAGDRFPWMRLRLSPDGSVEDLFEKLDDTELTLLAFGEGGATRRAAESNGAIRVLEIPDDPENARALERAGIPRPSFYLLRPDGHVGLCGSRPDAGTIAHYLSERLGLRPGSGGPSPSARTA